jgi:hypothetical protein
MIQEKAAFAIRRHDVTCSGPSLANICPASGIRNGNQGLLVLGFVSWTLGMTPKYSSVSKTHVVRALADDPDLKLISEQSPFMRSER